MWSPYPGGSTPRAPGRGPPPPSPTASMAAIACRLQGGALPPPPAVLQRDSSARVAFVEVLERLHCLLEPSRPLGQDDLHGGIQVAALAAAEIRHALAAQPQLLSALRPGSDPQPHRAFEGGQRHLAADHRLGDCQREVEVEVLPLAADPWVLAQLHADR